MSISPDNLIFWQYGYISINATLVFTWLVMALLAIGSWLITRNLTSEVAISRWQSILEVVISAIRQQLKDVSPYQPTGFLPFLASLFLFIAISNILSVIPGFLPPTGSLSTTTALSVCVFFAVPIYGISKVGFTNYLVNYMRPSVFMLPFNVLGELSRTLALAVRLFGNVMSGTMIGGILLIIAPLIFPVIMQLFGLLTGLVQAYIFTILAAVYISAAMEIQSNPSKKQKETV